MSIVYVKEQGASVRKRGGRIVVEKEGSTLAEVPLRESRLVALFGNVQVSTQALGTLADRGIPVAMYTRHGRLKARVVPEVSGAVLIRVAQAEAALNPTAALRIGVPVVRAKLANSRALVRAYRSNYPSDALAAAEDALEAAAGKARQAASLAELLGHEGAGAAAYFAAFGRMNRSGLPFDGRRKHPATDPINALLSLCYTMIMNECRAMADGLGLDPYLGFLHAPENGRPSLALDLIEPFRAPFADRLVLRLVNERTLTAADFMKRISGPMAGSVALNPGAWEKYLRAYEDAIESGRAAASEGLRKEMFHQTDRLIAALRGGGEFSPYIEDPSCAI